VCDLAPIAAATRRAGLLVALALALLLTPALGPSAALGRGLQIGFADPLYADPSPSTRALWLDRTTDASAGIVRLGVSWAAIAGSIRPADPQDPSDPAYHFAALDAAVRDASARGLEVLFTVQDAPPWAEGSNRPPTAVAPRGSWKPSPSAYGDFARALATRYSGDFAAAITDPPVPRVRYYQAWNEPNLDSYLTPQWKRGRPAAALHYRRLLNAFYGGVKAVGADAVVVTAGTAPFGDRRGGRRMRPLTFWRSLLCLKPTKATRCAHRARFDVASHHPITMRPRRKARHVGDAVIPELRTVRRLIRKAERRRTIGPRIKHRLWATELWWETNPPDPTARVSPRRQARWLAESLYLISRQRVGTVVLLQIRDMPLTSDPRATIQTGVYFENGIAKPALKAVRFPLVTVRRAPDRVAAWGRAPVGGELIIQRRGKHGWRRLKRLDVGAGNVFTTRLRLRGPGRLRAHVAGETSLVWRQKD